MRETRTETVEQTVTEEKEIEIEEITSDLTGLELTEDELVELHANPRLTVADMTWTREKISSSLYWQTSLSLDQSNEIAIWIRDNITIESEGRFDASVGETAELMGMDAEEIDGIFQPKIVVRYEESLAARKSLDRWLAVGNVLGRLQDVHNRIFTTVKRVSERFRAVGTSAPLAVFGSAVAQAIVAISFALIVGILLLPMFPFEPLGITQPEVSESAFGTLVLTFALSLLTFVLSLTVVCSDGFGMENGDE